MHARTDCNMQLYPVGLPQTIYHIYFRPISKNSSTEVLRMVPLSAKSFAYRTKRSLLPNVHLIAIFVLYHFFLHGNGSLKPGLPEQRGGGGQREAATPPPKVVLVGQCPALPPICPPKKTFILQVCPLYIDVLCLLCLLYVPIFFFLSFFLLFLRIATFTKIYYLTPFMRKCPFPLLSVTPLL